MTRTSTYIAPAEITIDTQLFATLLLHDFRYSIGRMTGAVSNCVIHLTRYWDLLPPAWQHQIQGDIHHAIKTNSAGMDMDVREWNKILTLTVKDDPE